MPSWRPGSTVAPPSISGGPIGVVERAVLEARRQPEPHHAVAQVGDRAERVEVRLRRRGRARQPQRIQRGAKGGGGNGRATQKRSTIDNVHLVPPSFESLARA